MVKLMRRDGAARFVVSYIYERAETDNGIVEVSPDAAAWAVGTGLYQEYVEPVTTASTSRRRTVVKVDAEKES